MTPSTLAEWLAHCERLHPREIDLTLTRVTRMRDRLGLRFEVPVFTVAGTNGKGSTCAMLEAILLQAGYRVGVYTSPHLVHFEERLRLNGEIVRPEQLLPHFEAVELARQQDAAGGREVLELTYFEFTTLAILHGLAAQPLDAVILEVGLGGRLDAVNVVDADCAVITCIDIDHSAWLGSDRESIGREKAGIMRANRPVIVSDPMPPASVVAHAQAMGADAWLFGRDFNYAGDRQQWSWRGRGRSHSALAYPALRGANQLINASGVLAALAALRDRLPVTAQAVRQGLAMVSLPGRFQIVPGQPAVVLDVAHNPHAAAALAQNLDQMGFFPRTLAVFGAMADKDLEHLVSPLLALIDVWHCCDLPTARAASAQQLAEVIRPPEAGVAAGHAPGVYQHASPSSALRAALAEATPADRIVVFGSFYTVGGVLEAGLPSLMGTH